MRTYTFRDGTVVPEGAMISATQTATHYDSAYYPNAAKFDGYRFYNARKLASAEHEGEEIVENNKEEDWRNRLTGTGLGYLAFGGGRHVWYVQKLRIERRMVQLNMKQSRTFLRSTRAEMYDGADPHPLRCQNGRRGCSSSRSVVWSSFCAVTFCSCFVQAEGLVASSL